MDKIVVAVKEPGKALYVKSVEPTLENFHKLVDCDTLEAVPFDGGIYMYLDDEGKLFNKTPNFKWRHGDIVVGNAVFVRVGFDGTELSLTNREVTQIQFYLELTSFLSAPFHQVIPK